MCIADSTTTTDISITESEYPIDNIDNFNKKALYLMVREMTNYKTAHITKVINKMRPHIIRMLGEFRRNGHLSDPSHYFSYKK